MPIHRLVVLALLALVVTACQLELVASAEVRRDGRGAVALELRLDEAMLAALDDVAVDPTAELGAALGRAEAWSVDRRVASDGGLVVTLSRPTSSPDELTDVLRDLAAGLSDDDPALLVDLAIDVAADGAAELAGTVGLRPPTGPGVLGDPAAPSPDLLAAATAARVAAELAVTLPGDAVAHDADEVRGRTLRWSVPVGTERTVNARSAAPTGPSLELVVAVVAGVLVVVSVVTVTWVAMKRRRGGSAATGQQRM